MSENIRLNNSNFCIGPQTGTYCTVDINTSPVTMKVKNSSGTLIRTYTFTPIDTLLSTPYVYASGTIYIAGQVMEAKSFIFDFADNYGNGDYMGIRSIEFYDDNDELIELSTDDFTTYVTTTYSSLYEADNIFDTSISKIGSANDTSWLSGRYYTTNQRLICVFNSIKYITKIVVNNFHTDGGYATRGVRNTTIYYTNYAYTNTSYGNLDPNFNTIFSSIIEAHVATNTVDDQILALESEEASSSSAGELVTLKYVGPLNQSSTYDNAIFYTLERIPYGYRRYYTYERDDETGEYIKYNDVLKIAQEVEYYGNIVRKWRINNTSFTLDLVSSSYKYSDSIDWFAADTFAIQTYQASLLDHVPSGTGMISFTTISGLSKYDTILIGPSSDTDNVSAVEEVYIHDIDYINDEVTIRTYGGADPTIYEYVEGDPITVIKYAHLPSKPKPLVNADGVRYAFDSTGGTLLSLDLNSYCDVVYRNYGGMFFEVQAADWNHIYDTVSFVKGCNLIHYDLDQTKPVKSQCLLNMYEKEEDPELITIYDINFNGSDIYRLQEAEITWDDTGRQFLDEFDTYNYIVDALEIYSSTINIYASNTIVGYQGVSYITAVVRDQFGVGLLNKDVHFDIENDITGVLDPSDGNVITDANGVCSVQYTAGADYNGVANITARAVGANSGFGSSYVAGHAAVSVMSDYNDDIKIKNILPDFSNFTMVVSKDAQQEGSMPIACYARRSLPGGEWAWVGAWAEIENPTIDDRNNINMYQSVMTFLSTVYQPTFNGISTDADGELAVGTEGTLPITRITQHLSESELNLPSEASAQDARYLSQNYLSRHLSTGNVVTATLNQFSFTQEAIPNFWSERNTTDIDYWIRLRPFAYSLDTTSLKIFVYEVSWAGTSTTIDIAPLGSITTFDAGSGLEGIDFAYSFPNAFHNNASVFVEVIVYDQAPTPNLITVSYWFRIIPDYLKPYIINKVPTVEAYDVPINTEITFDVLDNGDGVDISTLEVFINNKQITYTYVEYEPGQFNIICNIGAPFVYSQEVKITVFVNDLSDNANLLRESWTFYCISSSGPWFNIDDVSPGRCLQGTERTMDDVKVQVYAINSTGIDYDSLRLDVGGKYRNIKITPIIYRLK